MPTRKSYESALTARLRELIQRGPVCPDDVPEVYTGCAELLNVVEVAQKFCEEGDRGCHRGSRGRSQEFLALRTAVRDVTRPRPVTTPVCALVAEVNMAVETLNSELSRAYGNGFTWELGHNELNRPRWACAVPVLGISLFANVSKGCNDMDREWPSEQQAVARVRGATNELNVVMEKVVEAGYVCRLEPIQDSIRRVDTVKVTVLKKY